MISLYVVVCIITFDMQYWTQSRGPLNLNTISNLVFISQRGHYFQQLQQCVTPCNILPSMVGSFLTNNCKNSCSTSLQETAIEEVDGFSSKYVIIIWFILSKTFQFFPLALGWLCKPTCTTKQLYLGEGRWPITINIHAPHLDSQNAKFLQKMHMYVSSSTIESGNNGLATCSFQYLLVRTPYLTLHAHVSLAQKKILAQSTLWHFTPRERFLILILLFLH
jgi:hypothetical protein